MKCDGNHPHMTAARAGQPWTRDQCLLCWKAVNQPTRAIGPGAPPARRAPCKHLGNYTGETVVCGTCPSKPRFKLHLCEVHGQCLPLSRSQPDAHGCLDCPDYAPAVAVPDAGQVRHLLFHMWPVREPAIWKWHVEQLKQHAALFNGRRVLALVLDDQSESAGTVRRAVAGLFDDVLVMDNDPRLREVVTFEALFGKVVSLDPREAILWGHSKGTMRRNTLPAVRRWAELQYELYTDWPRVGPLLQQYPTVGAFKKLGRGFAESRSDWHYSGSWFWVRSRDLFSQPNWREIDRQWFGIEPYPSLHFSSAEAGCLFHTAPVRSMNLYRDDYWRDVVEPAYAKHRAGGEAGGLAAVDRWYRQLGLLDKPRVLEIGTRGWGGESPRNSRLSMLRVNPGTQWVGLDVEGGEDVSVVADLHEVSQHFPAGHFDMVFCASVLEHLRRPWVAAAELAKVVRPGGLLLAQTHQSFPLHGYPQDYFRFSREGLGEIFSRAAGWNVLQSEYKFPAKVVPTENLGESWNFQAEAWLNTEALIERTA